jgi:oligopeptide/dipeptide ABC transporter ATP-binding protein
MNTPTPLLEVSGLTVTYRRGRRTSPLTAVDNVDLSLADGQTLSIVGESGSGKSTIGNAILGLVQPAAGTITFRGQDITSPPAAVRRRLTEEIQVIFQNPRGSLNPVRTIGQILEEPLLAHRPLGRAQRRTEVSNALQRVGLDHDAASRFPNHFSGGQLQRIAIARALMLSPRLLVCDEAVSALDLSVQAQILNLLRQLQDELGLSYLFISHDLAVVRHISHRVVVLYRGQVMESGSASDICARPAHPYTQALLAAAPVPNPAEQRARRTPPRPLAPADAAPPTGRGCPFRNRCPHAVAHCVERLPIHTTATGLVACHRYGELSQDAVAAAPQ